MKLEKVKNGIGGGASGRAMAILSVQAGLESRDFWDGLGFFRFRIAANLFLLGAGLFLKNEE